MILKRRNHWAYQKALCTSETSSLLKLVLSYHGLVFFSAFYRATFFSLSFSDALATSMEEDRHRRAVHPARPSECRRPILHFR